MSNITELSISALKKAVALKEKIAKLEKELAVIIGSTSAGPGAKKGGMSAAGRARIAAAQKKRWAKIKAGQGGESAEKAPKRKMSAAGRAAISAAAKARWARAKAGK